jgi:hypothetical protein
LATRSRLDLYFSPRLNKLVFSEQRGTSHLQQDYKSCTYTIHGRLGQLLARIELEASCADSCTPRCFKSLLKESHLQGNLHADQESRLSTATSTFTPIGRQVLRAGPFLVLQQNSSSSRLSTLDKAAILTESKARPLGVVIAPGQTNTLNQH